MTMTISSISSAPSASTPLLKKGEETEMDQSDFLRLMTTQLTQQDPLNPVDNQAMVAQMAQFSSLAGITTTNERLQGIADQMSDQTQILRDLVALTTKLTPPPAPAPIGGGSTSPTL
jgi:flagellar basal-body rod modification protein FlgD